MAAWRFVGTDSNIVSAITSKHRAGALPPDRQRRTVEAPQRIARTACHRLDRRNSVRHRPRPCGGAVVIAALVPLFIIWFGIGEGSKIATLAFGVFFPTVITTAGGVDNVPRSLIRMAQSFGLRRAAIVRKVVLPAALPAILSGFRVTTSIAIVLLVAAEMIGAERGIGAFVLSAGNLYDTDNLLAGIVVLSLLGLAVAWVIGLLERRLLAWR
jgi:ABC-type methionine transport system permease subunit